MFKLFWKLLTGAAFEGGSAFEIEDDERIVHLCDYGGHGDIKIKCTQEWTRASWDQPNDLPAEVYLADNDMLYTFDDNKVSCEKCKA